MAFLRLSDVFLVLLICECCIPTSCQLQLNPSDSHKSINSHRPRDDDSYNHWWQFAFSPSSVHDGNNEGNAGGEWGLRVFQSIGGATILTSNAPRFSGLSARGRERFTNGTLALPNHNNLDGCQPYSGVAHGSIFLVSLESCTLESKIRSCRISQNCNGLIVVDEMGSIPGFLMYTLYDGTEKQGDLDIPLVGVSRETYDNLNSLVLKSLSNNDTDIHNSSMSSSPFVILSPEANSYASLLMSLPFLILFRIPLIMLHIVSLVYAIHKFRLFVYSGMEAMYTIGFYCLFVDVIATFIRLSYLCVDPLFVSRLLPSTYFHRLFLTCSYVPVFSISMNIVLVWAHNIFQFNEGRLGPSLSLHAKLLKYAVWAFLPVITLADAYIGYQQTHTNQFHAFNTNSSIFLNIMFFVGVSCIYLFSYLFYGVRILKVMCDTSALRTARRSSTSIFSTNSDTTPLDSVTVRFKRILVMTTMTTVLLILSLTCILIFGVAYSPLFFTLTLAGSYSFVSLLSLLQVSYFNPPDTQTHTIITHTQTRLNRAYTQESVATSTTRVYSEMLDSLARALHLNPRRSTLESSAPRSSRCTSVANNNNNTAISVVSVSTTAGTTPVLPLTPTSKLRKKPLMVTKSRATVADTTTATFVDIDDEEDEGKDADDEKGASPPGSPFSPVESILMNSEVMASLAAQAAHVAARRVLRRSIRRQANALMTFDKQDKNDLHHDDERAPGGRGVKPIDERDAEDKLDDEEEEDEDDDNDEKPKSAVNWSKSPLSRSPRVVPALSPRLNAPHPTPRKTPRLSPPRSPDSHDTSPGRSPGRSPHHLHHVRVVPPDCDSEISMLSTNGVLLNMLESPHYLRQRQELLAAAAASSTSTIATHTSNSVPCENGTYVVELSPVRNYNKLQKSMEKNRKIPKNSRSVSNVVNFNGVTGLSLLMVQNDNDLQNNDAGNQDTAKPETEHQLLSRSPIPRVSILRRDSHNENHRRSISAQNILDLSFLKSKSNVDAADEQDHLHHQPDDHADDTNIKRDVATSDAATMSSLIESVDPISVDSNIEICENVRQAPNRHRRSLTVSSAAVVSKFRNQQMPQYRIHQTQSYHDHLHLPQQSINKVCLRKSQSSHISVHSIAVGSSSLSRQPPPVTIPRNQLDISSSSSSSSTSSSSSALLLSPLSPSSPELSEAVTSEPTRHTASDGEADSDVSPPSWWKASAMHSHHPPPNSGNNNVPRMGAPRPPPRHPGKHWEDDHHTNEHDDSDGYPLNSVVISKWSPSYNPLSSRSQYSGSDRDEKSDAEDTSMIRPIACYHDQSDWNDSGTDRSDIDTRHTTTHSSARRVRFDNLP